MTANSGAPRRIPRVGLRLVLLALLTATILIPLAACGGGGASDPPASITQSSVSATNNPLVAQYSVTTSAASGAGSVLIQFGPTTGYGFQTSSQFTPMGGGTVNILVAGMKQNTLYHMRAVLTSDAGQVVDGDHTFQTGAIPPAMIPAMQVSIPPGQQPTPGIQMLSLVGEPMALDTAGNIIWYYNYQGPGYPWLNKLLPNGHILMLINIPGPPASSSFREVDLAGNLIRELNLAELTQKLHNAGYNIQPTSIDHDILFLPNGHLLFIVADTRVFTDLPGYPGQTVVSGNAVIDLDQNDNPAWVWDAFDHLDINRHPIYFPDWTHANALFYCPDDGNFLLSLRHQHWVLKIDYQNGAGSGDVLWRLGYQGDFTLLDSDSPADWFYAQHDANIASSNTTGDFQLAVFDNGNYRVLDDSGDVCDPNGSPVCYSNGAIFEVNETNMTAKRLWAYQTPFSFWGGSTQELQNSHVFLDETAPVDLGSNSSRIRELTQSPSPTTLWQVQFNNRTAYRALNMPSLYPGVQW